ncbi:hypothetical protein F5X97DRAFT_329668 [Nemania serpens]|nr:hypothetical protein F5X97DRAFT_329668 [Nemania serpens]
MDYKSHTTTPCRSHSQRLLELPLDVLELLLRLVLLVAFCAVVVFVCRPAFLFLLDEALRRLGARSWTRSFCES